MTTVHQIFNKGLLLLSLTAILFVAGIVVLPSLGPTYAEEAQGQTGTAEQAPAVNHNTWTSGTAMPTARYAAPRE